MARTAHRTASACKRFMRMRQHQMQQHRAKYIGRVLVYAVNEFDGGEDSFAAVTAFSYDHESYTLSYVNETSSMGQYPCHLSIDNTV